ncbi:hypothetical protein EGW08_021506 [Elysia chlorotica]|uniref:UspA domain-containing protein n=1 Tax=Elysia chlorotica TaxID=188477 RepID=A0A433SNG2_ELYCH|nr:hypothetical protein EGW08_021506 [Elysia chlorotica]
MASAARKIMIAMDGSKHAEHVFDWYVKYFYRDNDFVVVIYCTEHGALLSTPVPCSDPTFISKLATEEEVEITKLLKHYQNKFYEAKQQHPNMKGSVQRLAGRKPGPLIVDQAHDQNIDLILTGARGMSTLRRTVTGSVSTYIMQNSRVPVLIVRLVE